MVSQHFLCKPFKQYPHEKGGYYLNSKTGVITPYFSKKEKKAFEFLGNVANLKNKMSKCGMVAKKEFLCKKCKAEGFENVIHKKITHFRCGVRFCSDPDCLLYRFSQQRNTLREIQIFKRYKKLHHFVIGFESIPIEEFKQRHSENMKHYHKTINTFLKKVREKDISMDCVGVFDFSFKKDGYVYPHFHFGAIPFKNSKSRYTMKTIKEIEKDMKTISTFKKLNNIVISIKSFPNFHFQSFGLKSKDMVLSYLSIRAIGLYVHKENTKKYEFDKKVTKNLLKQKIDAGFYFHLNQAVTPGQYITHFYKKRHFFRFGRVKIPNNKDIGTSLYSSILTDNVSLKCQNHGFLDKQQVSFRYVFPNIDRNPPDPPDYTKLNQELKQNA